MRFTPETRGKAMGIWCASVPLGWLLAFSSAPWLVGRWDWPGVWWFCFFYALLGALLYYLFVRPVPRVAAAETGQAEHEKLSVRDLAQALRNRDLWLISFLFCCFNIIFIAFMTWFPTYCHAIRGLSLSQADLLMSVMTVLLLISGPFGGWLSDRLIVRGGDVTRVRKTFAISGLLLATLILPASMIRNQAAAMLLLTFACVSYGLFSSNVWAITQTLAGPASGKWTGMQNCIGNVSGVAAPFITGVIVGRTGEYFYAFVVVCAAFVIAACSYIFIVGKVEPIRWEQRA
jgi:nitrate/nitrite transporter NarK